SSLQVDYTSALDAPGSASFTVGQAEDSGVYSSGDEGQTLSPGSYYWRVRSIDDHGIASDFIAANGGDIAFIENTTPTDPPPPADLSDGSETTDYTPTLTFDLTDPDPDDTLSYQIQIDDSEDFFSAVVD